MVLNMLVWYRLQLKSHHHFLYTSLLDNKYSKYDIYNYTHEYEYDLYLFEMFFIWKNVQELATSKQSPQKGVELCQ